MNDSNFQRNLIIETVSPMVDYQYRKKSVTNLTTAVKDWFVWVHLSCSKAATTNRFVLDPTSKVHFQTATMECHCFDFLLQLDGHTEGNGRLWSASRGSRLLGTSTPTKADWTSPVNGISAAKTEQRCSFSACPCIDLKRSLTIKNVIIQ